MHYEGYRWENTLLHVGNDLQFTVGTGVKSVPARHADEALCGALDARFFFP